MTKTRDLSDFLIEGGADLPLGVPHIVPDVLYPAVSGNDLSGTALGGSYVYGTAHTDGRKYYYTDIKGSKPIKDPRIGAHFGSQRHKFKSLQLLEQESATHGDEVYSIDGREWVRGVRGVNAASAPYDDSGNRIRVYGFVEIVGYFIDVNLIIGTHTDDREFNTSVDGGSASSANTLFQTSSASSLGGRYVDVGNVGNLGLGLSLGIHTLKVTPQAQSENIEFFGIELIAQDTSSTANRSKIQIPAQNVVSFGKKFSVSAEGGSGHHYDPFSAKTDGSAWTSPTSGNNTANSAASWPTNIDTANSLGLENWVNGSSYYRPYNGGRVVKYVDSTGTIKTAVTVMPPNARSIGNAANLSGGEEKGDDSAGNTSAAAPNDKYKPTFTDQTIATAEDLHEVAKTFHFREFGNGSGNGVTAYADVSTATGTSDRVYVMDDGLTSYSGKSANVNATHGLWVDVDNGNAYITFIGTGVSWDSGANGKNTWAQNLPYGTHIVRYHSGNQQNTAYYSIDGVQVKSDFSSSGGSNYVYNWGFGGASGDITFHQPKRPPIPEDAVVLADYMLMADFVLQTAGTVGLISKGSRMQSGTFDVFYDGATSKNFPEMGFGPMANTIYHTSASSTANLARIPAFATNAMVYGYDWPTRSRTYKQNGVTVSTTNTGSGYGSIMRPSSSTTLGQNNFEYSGAGSSTPHSHYWDIATPIHTSHHYQSFETPFINELVGGDRNMEQTNLVCSPDGKTWDEITRDTSYIGNTCFLASRDGGDFTGSAGPYIYDYFRGNIGNADAGHGGTQKNFAIAYDRLICLVEGHYKVTAQNFTANPDRQIQVMKNSTTDANDRCIAFGRSDPADQTIALSGNSFFKRGDYISVRFDAATFRGNSTHYTFIAIEKI